LPVSDAKGETIPVWSPGRTYDSGAVEMARETWRLKGLEEHNRLLYVAMTRAKDRLVIAPYTGSKDAPQEAWCEMVRRSLVAATGGLERDEAPYGPIEIWRDGTAKPRAAAQSAVVPLASVAVPDWLTAAADPEPEPVPPIRPSSALGAADRITRPGDGPFAPEARLRGTLIHALLERLPGLPAERWAAVAQAYVEARAPRFEAAKQARIVGDTLRVLTDAAMAPLFGPGPARKRPVAGWIDTPVGSRAGLRSDRPARHPRPRGAARRLQDHRAPAGPRRARSPGLRGAAGAVPGALAEIYPDRPVRAFLVWTSGPLVARALTERRTERLPWRPSKRRDKRRARVDSPPGRSYVRVTEQRLRTLSRGNPR
jgi:ATP-dependent helicase/nuclease subunit A